MIIRSNFGMSKHLKKHQRLLNISNESLTVDRAYGALTILEMETCLYLVEQMVQWFFGILKNILQESNLTHISLKFIPQNSMKVVSSLEHVEKVDKFSFGI